MFDYSSIDIYNNGTYLIIAILIILKRDSLLDYNIGFYSLLIFLIAPAAELLSYYVFSGTILLDSWIKIGISICLFITLLFNRPKLNKRSVKEILLWLFIAVAVGICGGILLGVINKTQTSMYNPDRPSARYLFHAFFLQLNNAAIIEEPLLRGFLWGLLRNLHWKEYWILLFQTTLFMLGHLFYLGFNNFNFWIVIPVVGLILGLVAWRSRSIGTSMIMHGLINSVANIVASFSW
jgi:membrane protease YdiL (CAAX protease family)